MTNMFGTCFDNDQRLSRSIFMRPLRYYLPKFQLLSQRPPFTRMTTDHKLRESQIKIIITVLIKCIVSSRIISPIGLCTSTFSKGNKQ